MIPSREHRTQWTLRGIAGTVAALGFFACGDGGGGTGPSEQVVTTVTVTPATLSFSSLGATGQLTAVAKDQDGKTMSGVTFTWTSSAVGVATVNNDGLVAAVSSGTATITAKASGKSGTASATVDVKGAVRIMTSANGESGALDPDGYTVTVDGAPRAVGVLDTVVVTGVTAGNSTVELSGVADNCTVGGANPRTVAVAAADTAEAAFTVDCVTEVGMARWVKDLSVGCGYPGGCLPAAVALASDGTIYVPSYGDALHAVNPDGTIAWSYTTPDYLTHPPAVASDGTTYASGYSSPTLSAINPDGTLAWAYNAGGSIDGAPAIGADGTVYFGSFDKNLYAVNPDGTLKWTSSASDGRFAVGHPSVGSDGTIYVGITDSAYGGRFLAIGSDGTRLWSYSTVGQISGPPAIGADGTIYIGGIENPVAPAFDGNLYALNPDGTLKWKHQTQGGIYTSPVIAPDGTIYVGSGGGQFDPDQTGTFYAVNPDGSRKWSYPLPGCVGGSATIGSDGLIYVPTAGCVFGGTGILVVLNPDDGTLAWDFEVAGTYKVILGAPALAADGTLYMVSEIEGELYALKTASMGLANSPWPRGHHDNRNTGEFTAPLPSARRDHR